MFWEIYYSLENFDDFTSFTNPQYPSRIIEIITLDDASFSHLLMLICLRSAPVASEETENNHHKDAERCKFAKSFRDAKMFNNLRYAVKGEWNHRLKRVCSVKICYECELESWECLVIEECWLCGGEMQVEVLDGDARSWTFKARGTRQNNRKLFNVWKD